MSNDNSNGNSGGSSSSGNSRIGSESSTTSVARDVISQIEGASNSPGRVPVLRHNEQAAQHVPGLLAAEVRRLIGDDFDNPTKRQAAVMVAAQDPRLFEKTRQGLIRRAHDGHGTMQPGGLPTSEIAQQVMDEQAYAANIIGRAKDLNEVMKKWRQRNGR